MKCKNLFLNNLKVYVGNEINNLEKNKIYQVFFSK